MRTETTSPPFTVGKPPSKPKPVSKPKRKKNAKN
jgi:hypothetical protein